MNYLHNCQKTLQALGQLTYLSSSVIAGSESVSYKNAEINAISK